MLGGCATPLTVARDSARFAEPLGIATNDVKFLSYCSFGVAPKGPKPSFNRVDGVVVATASTMHLSSEKVQETAEPTSTSLRYSEVHAVAMKSSGFGCEIQIETKDNVIIVWVTPNKARWDCDASKALLGLIAATGVPVVEAQEWYGFKGGGGMSPIYIGPL